MKESLLLENKIMSLSNMLKFVYTARMFKKSIVFTNGCFDLFHGGHIYSLSQAAKEADIFIVGINSDESIKKIKGPNRPIISQDMRALLLAHLHIVNAVIIFDEETPLSLIKHILPDILVKGGDYKTEQIVGYKEVIANGGKVITHPLIENISTTHIIKNIQNISNNS